VSVNARPRKPVAPAAAGWVRNHARTARLAGTGPVGCPVAGCGAVAAASGTPPAPPRRPFPHPRLS